MSGSSKAVPLSHEEAKLLCSLLDRMNAAGRVPGDEDALYDMGVLGAMTDGSKRLHADLDEAGAEGYEHVGTPRAKQMTLSKPSGSQLPMPPNTDTGISLPPGIESLRDWGTTICKLPKVAAFKLSYEEMVDDPHNHDEYLMWILKHGADRGGRLEDLYLYLKATKYDLQPARSRDQLFPGTQEVRALASEASKDDGLREVLFEAVLRQHGWPPRCVADGIRWLQRKGLQLGAQHVRKATLLHGGLTPLRVLLMEMEPPLDVMGLEILVDHRCAVVTNGNTSGGGWVQRCKPALKALLARGAVLGSHSLQSRLLKRVEEDGMSLWVERVLESLRRCRPEVPDLVLSRIADFAGKGG
eukprot:s2127_g4.t1